MRLVTFKDSTGAERAGVWIDGDRTIVDVSRLVAGRLTMLDIIEGGEPALAEIHSALANAPTSAMLPTASVKVLAPLPVPAQMRDCLCFERHLLQSMDQAAKFEATIRGVPLESVRSKENYSIPKVWYEQPLYYKCNRFAVAGTGADVNWPSYSRLMDYELELAAVIGRRGKDIALSDANSFIFGYTVFNDFSARDAQFAEMAGRLGPAKGKDFDGSNILGPCIVTADELSDPYSLKMTASVNGELWSDGHSSSIHHSFEAMIHHISRDETIYPGEVIGSGTVGNGCGLELGRYLADGDVVRLEIEQIGAIENRIKVRAS